MPIITERFLATYTGPIRKDDAFRWDWPKRAGSGFPYTLIFNTKTRKFSGQRFGVGKRGVEYRNLSRADMEKLRRMLPPEELAACVAATLVGKA